jgi:hypothetical protein
MDLDLLGSVFIGSSEATPRREMQHCMQTHKVKPTEASPAHILSKGDRPVGCLEFISPTLDQHHAAMSRTYELFTFQGLSRDTSHISPLRWRLWQHCGSLLSHRPRTHRLGIPMVCISFLQYPCMWPSILRPDTRCSLRNPESLQSDSHDDTRLGGIHRRNTGVLQGGWPSGQASIAPIPCTLHSGVIRCLCSVLGYDGFVRVHESRYYELLLPSLSISGHPSVVPRIACIWVCNVATMGIPASGQYPIPRVGCSAEVGVMVVVVVCGRWLHIVEELSGGESSSVDLSGCGCGGGGRGRGLRVSGCGSDMWMYTFLLADIASNCQHRRPQLSPKNHRQKGPSSKDG